MKYGDSEVEALGQALVKTIERETALLSRVAEAYPVDHAAMLAIVHLRDQLTKANARVATLEATIAGYERRSYGWPADDPENTYADADDYASECELEHGVTFDWDVATVIRTERYRVVEHRDAEGNWTHTTAELVTDAATGPIGGVA